MSMMSIRTATPRDRDAIRLVEEHAFGQKAEAGLVDALVADGDAVVELVAEDDGPGGRPHPVFAALRGAGRQEFSGRGAGAAGRRARLSRRRHRRRADPRGASQAEGMPAKSCRWCWAIPPITAASAIRMSAPRKFESDYQCEALQALAWDEAPETGQPGLRLGLRLRTRCLAGCRATASTSSMTARPMPAGSGRTGRIRCRRRSSRRSRASAASEIALRGAGRTDAGVHATGQVAHVDLTKDWPADTVRDAINAHLQDGRRSRRDPRGAARRRTISTRASRRPAGTISTASSTGRAPPALEKNRAWWVPKHARRRSHARGRADAGRPARLHHLPLGPLPGEQPGADARPARCHARRRHHRDPRLGALLPAQPGALHGRHAEARRRGRAGRRPMSRRRWRRRIARPAARSRRRTGFISIEVDYPAA